MAAALHLVNAAAGKRLAAWLLDAVPPTLAVMIFVGLQAEDLAAASASGAAAASLASPSLLLLALLLAYGIALWGWEAQAGKTPGNLALGLRTADEDGFAPGWTRVFLRRLVVAAAGIVPVAGPVVVVLSNLWDPHHQRQGWHDRLAKTLVVDVAQGRDPLTTGGLHGPSTFAPGGVTVPGQSGHPELAPRPAAHAWPALAADVGVSAPISEVPGREPAAEPHSSERRPSAPSPAVAAVPADPAQTAPGEPRDDPAATDEDLGHTRLRRPAAAPVGARLVFDDGQVLRLDATALVGRNPAPLEGERVAALFNFADMGRSVSKTHLHLAADSSGVWVTDRNSTNGSGITAGGQRRRLAAGHAQRAAFGDTVHFGDRHFSVERA
ncbi:MAG: RDD family protein [Arthrobacter sp.]|uniref:RDD family protein n=1 Tax=Arthrobacter sp. TaxID=1667 RepID=UPI00346E18E5